MVSHSLRLALVAGLLLGVAACRFDSTLAGSPTILCSDGRDCPESFACSTRLHRCVRQGGDLGSAPRLTVARITPPVARRGQEVALHLETQRPLALPPEVVIAEANAAHAPTLVSASADGLTFDFRYAVGAEDVEGPAAVTATLVDVAGVLTEGAYVGSVTFDFSAPTLSEFSFVSPRSAGDAGWIDVREADVVAVRLTLSERVVGGARVTATASTCDAGAIAFVERSNTNGVLDFAVEGAGQRGCDYVLRASGLEDVVGNVASPLQLPGGYHVDDSAVSVFGLETFRTTDAGLVLADVFSREPGFDEVGLRFSVSPQVTALTVRFDNDTVAGCTLAQCDAPTGAARACRCARRVTAADREFGHELTVTGTNAAGSAGAASRPLRFDFTGPRLLPSGARVTYDPSPYSVLRTVTTLGIGGSAHLTLLFDDDLVGVPQVSFQPADLQCQTTVDGPAVASATCTVAGQVPDGPRSIAVRARDALGNVTQSTTSTTVLVEGRAPRMPDLDSLDAVTLTRSEYALPLDGGPRYFVTGQPGAAEPATFVLALDDRGAEISRTLSDDAGAFQLGLGNDDRTSVWLMAISGAGNPSDAGQVKNVVWVSGVEGQTVGGLTTSYVVLPAGNLSGGLFSPPPELTARQWLTAPTAVRATVTNASDRLLAFSDTDAWEVTRGGRWRQLPVDARAPVGLQHLFEDAPRGRVVGIFADGGIAELRDGGWSWVRWGVPPLLMTADFDGGVPLFFDAVARNRVYRFDGSTTRLVDVTPFGFTSPPLTTGYGANLTYDSLRGRPLAYGCAGSTMSLLGFEDGGWGVVTTASSSGPLLGGQLVHDPATDFTWVYMASSGTNCISGTSTGEAAFLPTGGATSRSGASTFATLAHDLTGGSAVVLRRAATTTSWATLSGWPAEVKPAAIPLGAAWDRRSATMLAAPRDGGATYRFDARGWAVVADADAGPAHVTALALDSQRDTFVAASIAAAAGDVWEFSDAGWRLRQPGAGPAPRQGALVAYDARRGVTVFAGGRELDGGPGLATEVWEWSGSAWQQGPASPRAIGTGPGAAVYHRALGKLVVWPAFGVGEYLTYDGVAWTPVTAPTPPGGTTQLDYAPSVDLLRAHTSAGASVLNGTWVSFGGSSTGTRVTSSTGERAVILGASDAVFEVGYSAPSSLAPGVVFSLGASGEPLGTLNRLEFTLVAGANAYDATRLQRADGVRASAVVDAGTSLRTLSATSDAGVQAPVGVVLVISDPNDARALGSSPRVFVTPLGGNGEATPAQLKLTYARVAARFRRP